MNHAATFALSLAEMSPYTKVRSSFHLLCTQSKKSLLIHWDNTTRHDGTEHFAAHEQNI